MEPIRLQKLFSDCGILSRRKAESEIENGKVLVNGKIATLGQKVDIDTDEIKYNGKIIKFDKEQKEYIYIMLNKPTGIVTSLSDEKGRKCVTDIVKVKSRIYPIGRLDLNSEGLLLLTNDGDLTNKLTHPRHEIPKIYEVLIKEKVDGERLDFLRSSMVIDDYRIQPVKVEKLKSDENGDLLQMTLYEGRNRQIRKMCESASLTIKNLKRVAIGKLKLGDLKVGKWRYLTDDEIKYLK